MGLDVLLPPKLNVVAARRGRRGPTGPDGPEGPEGPKGDTGDPGPKGDKGDRGPKGPAGPRGEQGERGIEGAMGYTGPAGDRGPEGPAGTTTIIQDEEVELTHRNTVSFQGAGVTAADDVPNARTIVTIPGGGGGGADDQTAAEVPVTPAGGIASANVQAALEELDTEKSPSTHNHDAAYSPTAHHHDAAYVNEADHTQAAHTAGLGLATQAGLDAHAAAADPHAGYQKESEKGAVGGYASLDGGGTVPDAQIPASIARDSELPDLAGHAAAADPHTGYQKESEKGAVNGYASLDAGGTVPDAQIPAAVARDAEVTTAVSNHEAAADPHAGYQKETEKGAASGYASLDAGGKVPDSEIPAAIARDSEVTTAVTNHEGAADPHTGYQKESEKSAASGYASLDAGIKVPTAELGGAGADATKFLRGDQSWAVPAGGGGGAPTFIHKTVDESIASSTVYQADNELVLPVGANEIWFAQFVVFYEAPTAADLKIQARGPAGVRFKLGVYGFDAADTNNPGLMGVDVLREAAGESHLAGFGIGSPLFCRATGLIVNGATAGDVVFEWAQRVSNAAATVVLQDSFILAHQVA